MKTRKLNRILNFLTSLIPLVIHILKILREAGFFR